MKYIFEENDVKAGNYVLRRGLKDMTCLEKIGFVDIDKNQKCCLISMTDGFVAKFDSKNILAKHLNEERYHPLNNVQAIKLMNKLLIKDSD